jgi:HTH-type transcriptional regulator / antitoxin HigA
MSIKDWEAKVLARPGAGARIAEIEKELRLAVALTALRESAGKSQRQVAALLGVSQPRVAAIERARNITIDVVEKYVQALGGTLEITVSQRGDGSTGLVVTSPDRRAPQHVVQALSSRERMKLLRTDYPILEFQKKGWVPKTADPDAIEAAIETLLAPLKNANFAVAGRRSNNSVEPFTSRQNAWVGRVLNRASDIAVAPYDPAGLSALAAKLRDLNPSDLGSVSTALAACGVVLIFEHQLVGSKLDGAAMLRSDGVPVIGLTTRGDRFDIVLWTLLHEIAHIYLGHVNSSMITLDEDIVGVNHVGREAEADKRASEWLFPDGFSDGGGPYRAEEIKTLAKKNKVHPSVVVGQLQRRGKIQHSEHSAFREKARLHLPATS